MATFTVPATLKTPPIEVGTKGLSKRLFARYRGDPQANYNVYILKNGTVVTEEPQSTYTAAGVLDQTSEQQIAHAFYGGHAPETVTAAEAALLTAAGFTVT